MLDGEGRVETTRNDAGSAGNLAFVIFSLTHADCGEEGVIELRLGERSLLGWCPSGALLVSGVVPQPDRRYDPPCGPVGSVLRARETRGSPVRAGV